MKNDKAKAMLVVLLDAERKPVAGSHTAVDIGPAGFRLWGMNRVLYWADEGKTWKRVEEEL